jgi:hypothetical protein
VGSMLHPKWAQSGISISKGKTDAWATAARGVAMSLPEYNGDIDRNGWIIQSGTWLLVRHSAVVILTRDNMVTLGWWKNIEFAHCLHLSISFRDLATLESAEWNARSASEIVKAVFHGAARLTWWEPAYSDHGKRRGVQHWRLFYAADWQTPIHPQGEPHTLNVPAGWSGWTEYQAGQPTPNFNADITDELPLRRFLTNGDSKNPYPLKP